MIILWPSALLAWFGADWLGAELGVASCASAPGQSKLASNSIAASRLPARGAHDATVRKAGAATLPARLRRFAAGFADGSRKGVAKDLA
jgi:hypothetical protein